MVFNFLIPFLNSVLIVTILLDVAVHFLLQLVSHLGHQICTRFQTLSPFEHLIFFEEVCSDVELAAIV